MRGGAFSKKMSLHFDCGNAAAFPFTFTPKNEIFMKTKIALILMALACAFTAVPAHAEEVSPAQIREWRAAANRGEAVAQCNLGVCYATGNGVEKDLVEAVRWYRKSAEQGYAVAQCFLGLCYANGDGVEKDLVEAVRWYRKSAEQGLSNAKLALEGVDFWVPER